MSQRARETTRADRVCCQRPMTTIEVTSPVEADAYPLALHACPACGRHIWEGAGAVLDRDEVLEVMEHRTAQATIPRTRRRR